MSMKFIGRLVLDFIAAGLLLIGLAYYWLDNVTHELIGTLMFVLLIAHNMFNRRWYGNLPKTRHASLGLIRPLINLSLLFSMVVLLITSALISRSVFRALQLEDSFTAGRIHALAAYVVLIIVSLHLGMHGSMIINTLRNLLGIKSGNAIRRGVLRGVALGIAGYGIYSSFLLGVGSKLTMQLSLEWWDFEASTWDFFVHVVAVMGLYAFIAHYAVQFYPVLKSRYTPSSVLRRLG